MDRLGWTAGLSIKAYGHHIGIRVSDEAILPQVEDYLPPGWEATDVEEVEILYSLKVGGAGKRKGVRHYNLLYAGAGQLARTHDLTEIFDCFEKHLQLSVATISSEGLFIHAGVVGWQGQAIIIPGRSFSGKTTLVAELVKAGATYYSDEYAVITEAGLVLPYPRKLSMRNSQGQHHYRCPPQELGAVGVDPLPVGLVLVTHYHQGARWQARTVTPGNAMLALLDNTVAARYQPEDTMKRLQKVVSTATTIKTKRGEAADVAGRILAIVSKTVG